MSGPSLAGKLEILIKIVFKKLKNFQNARTNGSFGYLQLALTYNQLQQVLHVRIISARALPGREHDGTAPNAFVKIYLMPGRK